MLCDLSCMQACLPVAIPDLAYNLVSTHDEDNAFLIVDHDEEDLVSALAPIGNVYAPSAGPHPPASMARVYVVLINGLCD